MEEASTGITNDGASNVFGIEEAPAGTESLNTDTHWKLLALPFPKVVMLRKGIASISM